MPPVVAFIGAAAGAIGAAGAAIGGVIGAVGSTALGGAALSLGKSLLLSAAASAVLGGGGGGGGGGGTAKQASQRQARPINQTVRQGDAPRELVYGKVRKGGVYTFMHVTGTTVKDFHLVIAMASNRCQSIGAIYFNGVKAVEANGVPVARYDGLVSVVKRLGDDNQSAIPIPAAGSLWGATYRMRGIAHFYIRLTYNATRFPNGLPNITADIEGKNDIYDPRTETTGYTRNAALIAADYMTNSRHGMALEYGGPLGVHLPTLIASANICAETVLRPGGGTEPRYCIDGVVRLDESRRGILQTLLGASAGWLGKIGGARAIYAGAHYTPTVVLNESNLSSIGATFLAPETSASNRVRGRFMSPGNGYTFTDYPAVVSSVFLADDSGQARWATLDLPFTTSSGAAQRLAKIEMFRSRQRTVKMTGNLKSYLATAGRPVAVEWPRWGLSGTYLVNTFDLSLSNDGNLETDIEARASVPAIYDWAASEETLLDQGADTTFPDVTSVANPGSPVIAERQYVTTDGGGVRVAADISWIAAEDGFVTGYALEGAYAGGAYTALAQTQGTSWEFLDVSPGPWVFRVRAVNSIGAVSEWVETSRNIVGLSDDPVALENFAIQRSGGLAILSWDKTSDLDVEIGGSIELRRSNQLPAIWDNAVHLRVIAGSETNYIAQNREGTFFARAIDQGGRLGPIVSVESSGATTAPFVTIDFLQADPTFLGGKTYLIVINERLSLEGAAIFNGDDPFNSDEGFDWGEGCFAEGLYEFQSGIDLGELRAVQLRSDFKFTAFIMDDTFDGNDAFNSPSIFNGTDGSEVSVYVEFRTSATDPNIAPVWSEWAALDITEVDAWGVQARARVVTTDPVSINILVEELRVSAREAA